MSVRYLLDTDTCVAWLRRNEAVRRHVAQVGPAVMAVSIITVAELPTLSALQACNRELATAGWSVNQRFHPR